MLSIGEERAKQRGLFRIWLVAPVVYVMIFPIVLFDLATSMYQAICFRAYGIPRVKRRTYVRLFSRGRRMVTLLDRFNCAYCTYANGVAAYARAVLIETEQYWCPIKYKPRKDFHIPHPHDEYADPDDEAGLRTIVRGKK